MVSKKITIKKHKNQKNLSLTDDEYRMFNRIWQTYDPDGTEFILYSELFDFVANLEKPFRIRQPNRSKLISMDFPLYKINENDSVYRNDIVGLYKQNL